MIEGPLRKLRSERRKRRTGAAEDVRGAGALEIPELPWTQYLRGLVAFQFKQIMISGKKYIRAGRSCRGENRIVCFIAANRGN